MAVFVASESGERLVQAHGERGPRCPETNSYLRRVRDAQQRLRKGVELVGEPGDVFGSAKAKPIRGEIAPGSPTSPMRDFLVMLAWSGLIVVSFTILVLAVIGLVYLEFQCR